VQVFPTRRPLLLCPLNECGVRKFVCTTVRPTKLPYNSIYDLKTSAEFLADFIEYLPLDDPLKLVYYCLILLLAFHCINYTDVSCDSPISYHPHQQQ
jgi:hypothetical protein